MRLVLGAAVIAAITSAVEAAQPRTLAEPEVLNECQGEGCDCYEGYRTSGGTGDFDIVTIRQFTLFERMSPNSRVLGRFKSGVKGKPLGPRLLIEDRGEYLVETLQRKPEGLAPGDQLDTLLYQGEGAFKARKGGVWVHFDHTDAKLKTVRETKVSEWLELVVAGKRGFTRDSPFEGCLE
jgi:hypothetical protein